MVYPVYRMYEVYPVYGAYPVFYHGCNILTNQIVGHFQLFNIHDKSGRAWYATAHDHPNHEVRYINFETIPGSFLWLITDLTLLPNIIIYLQQHGQAKKSRQVSQETTFTPPRNLVDSKSVPGKTSLMYVLLGTRPSPFLWILKSTMLYPIDESFSFLDNCTW